MDPKLLTREQASAKLMSVKPQKLLVAGRRMPVDMRDRWVGKMVRALGNVGFSEALSAEVAAIMVQWLAAGASASLRRAIWDVLMPSTEVRGASPSMRSPTARRLVLDKFFETAPPRELLWLRQDATATQALWARVLDRSWGARGAFEYCHIEHLRRLGAPLPPSSARPALLWRTLRKSPLLLRGFLQEHGPRLARYTSEPLVEGLRRNGEVVEVLDEVLRQPFSWRRPHAGTTAEKELTALGAVLPFVPHLATALRSGYQQWAMQRQVAQPAPAPARSRI